MGLGATLGPCWPWPTNAARSDWEFDVGARTWFSSGTVGAPQALLGVPPLPSSIISRLTYENAQALSGETFARVDHRSGLFVKGFVGAGGISHGTLVDEDFPGDAVYSNTRSPLKGNIGYANIDVGYNFLTAPGAKVGAFVGYNYYTQHLNGFGCNQVASGTFCTSFVDPNYQVFGEDERYDALRVGLSAEFMLTDRLKFSAEAAYLPRVRFSAQDDHNYRQLFIHGVIVARRRHDARRRPQLRGHAELERRSGRTVLGLEHARRRRDI